MAIRSPKVTEFVVGVGGESYRHFRYQRSVIEVMQVGGWSSFSAIEQSLNAPTPEVVNDQFQKTSLV